MGEILTVGSRIKISESYYWAKNATGEIAPPPAKIIETSDGWNGIARKVSSLKGSLLFYWVKFEVPQIDADGDVYHEAEVDSNYLSLLVEKT